MAEALPVGPSPTPVLDKAVPAVLDQRQLKRGELAAILDLPPDAVSRAVRSGTFATTGRSREHRELLVRLCRALDSIVDGDDRVAATWLRNECIAPGAVPIERMKHPAGLVDVLAHIDSRRAPI